MEVKFHGSSLVGSKGLLTIRAKTIATVEQLGRVDALVSNAAYILVGAAEELELDAIRKNPVRRPEHIEEGEIQKVKKPNSVEELLVAQSELLKDMFIAELAIAGIVQRDIAKVVRAHIREVQYCYEKRLLEQPGLKGTIQAKFTVDADGKVGTSTATGVDAQVASCVAAVIEGLPFERPSKPMEIDYPFSFTPAQ